MTVFGTVPSVADAQAMTEHLRSGLVARMPAVVLEGTVEIDEVAAAIASSVA